MSKKIKYLFFICCYVVHLAFAGHHGNDKATKKIKKEADLLYEKKEYSKAFPCYMRIYDSDSLNSDLNYRIGVCLYNSKERKLKSLKYFEKCDKISLPETSFYLGTLYHSMSKFNEAIKSFENYQSLTQKKEIDSAWVNLLISKSKNAIEITKCPLNVVIHNMGEVINSPYPDYAPLVSADENMLIFTSRRSSSKGGLQDLNGEYMEDVYVSYKQKAGSWGRPKSISKNINTDFHDAGVALSPDGQQLIVYRTSDDMLSGDLYISRFNGKDWSEPQMLGSDINMEDAVEASATFSPDDNMLIFSSDRPGGYGGKDLYRVVRLPNGRWSKAQNLGSTVNTKYDEDGPFMHEDGTTLYFSSKAHDNNIGGYDVYKSTLNEDGSWCKPENIGYPINTVNDDIFIFSVNGNLAYFSSQSQNSFGASDIYTLDVPDQNFGLAIVSCRLLSTDTLSTPAIITLIDKDNEDFHARYTCNRNTGKFIMIVNPGRTYRMTVQAEGFLPVEKELFFTTEDFTDNVKEMNFKLLKIIAK